jgi:hypothetical protein
MVNQARSSAKKRNPDVTALERRPDEGNLAWGERAAAEMIGDSDPREHTYMVLLGGADTLAFRLRVAQSHLRSDMLPSLWSEALLVRLKGPTLRGSQAISVPLAQPGFPFFSPADNGVVEISLARFDDPERYPNIALFALPIPQARILARVELFKRARSSLDALEHVLRWLAFSWGVTRTGNPLHENMGLPSACMLEIVCAAEDFELTPGLESRTSCPEAIWASMLHWHEYYAATGEKKVPFGRFSRDHGYAIFDAGGDTRLAGGTRDAQTPLGGTNSTAGRRAKTKR